MEDEPNSIASRDWRLHFITTLPRLPSNGIDTPNDSPATPAEVVMFTLYQSQQVGITLPSPVAMYISVAEKQAAAAGARLPSIESFRQMPDGGRHLLETSERSFFDTLECLFASMVFSHSALEVYANEQIPDEYVFNRERSDQKYTEVYSKRQMERNLSLEAKLHEVLPIVLGIKSPKGTKLWERFVWLKELRDRLIHLKSSDWRSSVPEAASDNVWASLLEPRTLQAPKVAVEVISHFAADRPPRWLRKWSAEHGTD